MLVRSILTRVHSNLLSTSGLKAQLIRGGIGNALIQVCNRALALAVGVVLAKGLGAEGYGVYSYAFALMSLLSVFACFGMPTMLVREVAKAESKKDWRYLRGVLVWGLSLALLLSVVITAISFVTFWKLYGGLEARKVAICCAMSMLPFFVLTKTITASLRGLQQVVKSQAVELLLRQVLFLLAVTCLYSFAPDLCLPQYILAIQLVVFFVVMCAAVLLLYRYLPKPVYKVTAQFRTRRWLNSAMPLVIIGGTGIINNQADILMLGLFRSAEDVGIYRVAVQGSVLVSFGLQAGNMVIAPHIARLHSKGDQIRLQRLVTASARIILLIALPVALIFIIKGGVLAGYIFGSNFEKSHTALAVLAFGQLINATMGSVGYLLNMTGNEHDVARTLIVTAGINVLLNLSLIPTFGLAGAAAATSISLIVWNFILYRIVKKRIGINSTVFAMKEVAT